MNSLRYVFIDETRFKIKNAVYDGKLHSSLSKWHREFGLPKNVHAVYTKCSVEDFVSLLDNIYDEILFGDEDPPPFTQYLRDALINASLLDESYKELKALREHFEDSV